MKQIRFRKDTETPFSTKTIFMQLLSSNEGGGTIKDMIKKVELKERIEAEGPEDGVMAFKDNEYDLLKNLYENNKFPVNLRFFIDVHKDIEDYTSVDDPKKPKLVENREDANKA